MDSSSNPSATAKAGTSTARTAKDGGVSPVGAETPCAGADCDAANSGETVACGTGHWKAKTDDEWRKLLTPEQYRVAREAGTERAFSGKYWATKTKGVYHCAACDLPLFTSEAKFDSGTGWPSFTQPVKPSAVTTHTDAGHGMVRTEVRCSRCGSHLGHVFDDGPRPGGLRYCLNSAVLNLVSGAPEDGSESGK